MEKINRLTFLRRTGLSAAALAVGAYGKAEADIIDADPEANFGKRTDIKNFQGKIEFKNVNFSF